MNEASGEAGEEVTAEYRETETERLLVVRAGGRRATGAQNVECRPVQRRVGTERAGAGQCNAGSVQRERV